MRIPKLPQSWRPPRLTRAEKQQRRLLGIALRVAKAFEKAARPGFTGGVTPATRVHYVLQTNLIRALQVAQVVLAAEESPVALALIRILIELYVNVAFILSDPVQMEQRGIAFWDFLDVDRIRLVQEIAERFPNLAREIDRIALKTRLEGHEGRFFHTVADGGTKWDWDGNGLIGRLDAVAKAEGKTREERRRVRRTAALYKESHPYIHSGMISLLDSYERGGGSDALRPRHRLRNSQTAPTLFAAQILLDLLGKLARPLSVHAYDSEIQELGRSILALYEEITPSRRASTSRKRSGVRRGPRGRTNRSGSGPR